MSAPPLIAFEHVSREFDGGRVVARMLSGGERQRVAIARSIVNRPTLLLADEPTGNVDSANGKQIIDLLFDLHRTRGVTPVLVTHDPNLAAACERQVGIKDGRLSERAPARLREAAR